MDPVKVELLNDHYKDSCALNKIAQTDRNRMFLCLCFITAIQFLFIVEPTSIILIITSWLKETYEVDISIQVNMVQILLWLVLLYCTMRYYQLNCYVERQYKYIHSLEKRISEFSELAFDRESENYLEPVQNLTNMI